MKLNIPLSLRAIPGRGLARYLAAPSVLRLALGRAGTPAERQLFNHGFTSPNANMPPLLFGLLGMPDGRSALLRSAEIAWHRGRAIEQGDSFNGFSDLDGNIFAAWTGRKLGFLHIEKCGGCAVLSWLARQFHPQQINSDPCRDLPPHLFTRLPQDREHEQPLIWGHYDMATLQRADPDRAVFTVLREPRARLLSLYHYWRSVDPAKIDPDIAFAVGYAHRLSLEDFLNHDDPCLVDNIDNVYVRRLTGLYATGVSLDPLRAAPQDALRRATDLLNTLFYVGITEEMERSAAGLAARLNIAAPEAPVRSNVTAENHHDPSGWFRKITRSQQSRAQQSRGVQAALDRRTVLDRELYAGAKRRFEAGGKEAVLF